MPFGFKKTFARIDAGAFATPLFNSRLIALALADHDRLLFSNAAFDRMFGRTENGANGSMLDLLARPTQTVGAALRGVGNAPIALVAEGLRRDGTTFEVELHCEQTVFGGAPALAIFARDITDRFQDAARLSLLAYSDPLTSLGNRAMFADRLRVAMLSARRTAGSFAVVLLDLDGFKGVNDRYGHAVGDKVLQRIAARFLAALRDTDTTVRMGGDEFAVLLPVLAERAEAMGVANRLVELARQPIDLGLHEVTIGASAGIAIFPEHAGTVDDLLAAADRAVYAAKRNGRGCSLWAMPAWPGDAVPARLVWNIAHEVGVAEVDEQHAKLVDLLNNLIAVLRNGDRHEAALAEVIRYTEFHFACEERLMLRARYHGTVAHRQMHQRLLEDLHGLRMDGVVVSVGLIARYLQEWLIRHVDGADRDMAAAVRAAGVDDPSATKVGAA